jgi:hypothetical protein
MTPPGQFKVSKRKLGAPEDDGGRDLVRAFDEAGPRAEVFANAVRSHSDLGEEPERYADEIRKLWGQAARKFIAIGEYLLQAKLHFEYGEKMKRLEAMLPFGYATAHRFMRIAEAVQGGRLPRDHLPANYATAYVLTTMSEEDLEEAKDRNLVREDVTRKALEDFMAERRQPTTDGRSVLLMRERRRLQAQMDRIRARLAQIDQEIGPVAGGTVIEGVAEETKRAG